MIHHAELRRALLAVGCIVRSFWFGKPIRHGAGVLAAPASQCVGHVDQDTKQCHFGRAVAGLGWRPRQVATPAAPMMRSR